MKESKSKKLIKATPETSQRREFLKKAGVTTAGAVGAVAGKSVV